VQQELVQLQVPTFSLHIESLAKQIPLSHENARFLLVFLQNRLGQTISEKWQAECITTSHIWGTASIYKLQPRCHEGLGEVALKWALSPVVLSAEGQLQPLTELRISINV
jgi:hypothetical protein